MENGYAGKQEQAKAAKAIRVSTRPRRCASRAAVEEARHDECRELADRDRGGGLLRFQLRHSSFNDGPPAAQATPL